MVLRVKPWGVSCRTETASIAGQFARGSETRKGLSRKASLPTGKSRSLWGVLCGRRRPPFFQRGKPRLGVGNKLPYTGFGARVLRKAQNCPHPHDAVPQPSHLILGFGGHWGSVSRHP
jgi:hypothetical protein